MKATIDGIEVPIPQDKIPAFSFSMMDLQDPSSVQGSRSTTFTMPATVQVNRVLGGPSLSERVNARRPRLRIGSEGQVLYESVVVPVENSREEVSVVSVGDNAEWFELAKATKLRSLEMGDTPIITNDYQISSWTDDYTVAYFPLINYGWLTSRGPTFNVNTKYLRPAGRVHLAVSKAFNDWGFDFRVKGSLASLWPKLVCPSTRKKIQAAQSSMRALDALYRVVPFTTSPTGYGFSYDVDFTATTDPAGTWVTPGYYKCQFDMVMNPTISIIVSALFVGNGSVRAYVRNVTAGGVPTLSATIPLVSGVSQTLNLDLGQINASQNDELAISFQVFCAAASSSFSIEGGSVTWTVDSITYNEDIAVEVADLYPDMTVMELLKAVTGNRCLVFETNTARGTVDMWYDSEYFRTQEDGIDWSKRMNHDEPPVKMLPMCPTKMEFRWKEDTKDADLIDVNETVDAPGYGNYDHVFTYGTDKPKKVDMPFAATAMGTICDGLWVPIMRKEDGTAQVDDYDRVPRILLTNGTAPGLWRHDGFDLDVYPVCYFIQPGQPFTMAFGDGLVYGDTQPGTAQREYVSRFRRIESPSLKALVKIYPDEVWGASFGRPRLINDGFGNVWCYVQEIDQFQFTGDDYTTATFIPM